MELRTGEHTLFSTKKSKKTTNLKNAQNLSRELDTSFVLESGPNLPEDLGLLGPLRVAARPEPLGLARHLLADPDIEVDVRRHDETERPGTNVMIIKIISPKKKLAKMSPFFSQTNASFCKNMIVTLVFEKSAHFS
jgi:hypothetical protein